MKKGFNLLKAKVVPPSFWTKAYNWVLGTAKVVIILTELLLLVAFVIRFVIDTQQKELDKQIKTAENTYQFVNSNEEIYRIIQFKTASYKIAMESGMDYQPLITSINSLVPMSPYYSSLGFSVNKDKVAISGVGDRKLDPKNEQISEIEKRLKSQSIYLKDTALSSLVNNLENSVFTFSSNITNIVNKKINGSTDQ